MKNLNELNDELKDRISKFIVNELGINLCSVDSIYVNKQEDGQIKNILITFFPNNITEE